MQRTLLKKAHPHGEHHQVENAPAQPDVQRQAGGFPLALAGLGQRVQVNDIRGGGDTPRFLESLGFVPGSEITVVCENGGNLIVDVKGSRVALARQMASKIMVGSV